MPPQDETIFLGFDADDLIRMAEVLLISLLIIAVLLFIVRPFVVLVSEAIPAKRRIRWDDYIRHVVSHVEAAPSVILKTSAWVFSLIAAFYLFFLIFAEVCEGRMDACQVWSEPLVSAVILAIGAYYFTYCVFRICRYGSAGIVHNNKFYVGTAAVVGIIPFIMSLEWSNYFGENCLQTPPETGPPGHDGAHR